MRKISALTVVLIITSCSSSINNIPSNLNVNSDIKQPSENKMPEIPSSKIKNIYSFPEYLILEKGESKPVFIQIQTSENKISDNYIITSLDTSIVKVEGKNNIKAVKEGKTIINIFSELDISKIRSINVEVINNKMYYTQNLPISRDFNSYISHENKILIEDNLKKLYSYDLSNGYVENITSNNTINRIIKPRRIKEKRSENDTNFYTYNLYVDIYDNDILVKTIQVDKPYTRQEKAVEGDVYNVYPETYKSVISLDKNNGFIITYLFNYVENSIEKSEYRAKLYNSNGEFLNEHIIMPENDVYSYFNFDISENKEKNIFSNYKNNRLDLTVLDNKFKKIYQSYISPNSSENYFENDLLFKSLVSINDIGEMVIAWRRPDKIFVKKIDMNTNKTKEYVFNVEDLYELSGLSINNAGDINIVWNNDIFGAKVGMKFIPGDRNKVSLNLALGQIYKVDDKYTKCVSSNDSIIKIEDRNLIASDYGRGQVSCFNEANYEKNITLNINVPL